MFNIVCKMCTFVGLLSTFVDCLTFTYVHFQDTTESISQHKLMSSLSLPCLVTATVSGQRSVWLKCGHNDNWGLPPQARSEIIVNTNATTGILYSNHPAQTGDLLGLECNLVKVYRWSKGPILPGNSRKENTCLITWIILPSTNIQWREYHSRK